MKQRIITALLAGSGFLSLLYLGRLWFAALILLLAVVAYYEFLRMFQYHGADASSLIGFISIIYVVIPWGQSGLFHWMPVWPLDSVIWVLMFLFLSITVFSKNRSSIDKVALVFVGTIYIGVGFHYMIVTRWLEHGLFWTLLLFACIWVTDTGAYFTGRTIGKRLLWPSISPKKTVEGAIGGIALSVAAAIGFSLYKPALLEITDAVLIGIVVAVVGQLGDFVQSAYKRVRGVKDSGSILPGHGGLLDRCDSWLIVFPFVHLLFLLPSN